MASSTLFTDKNPLIVLLSSYYSRALFSYCIIRMEKPAKVNLGYSLKNIPIPSEFSYKKSLIEKVESLIKRMRWRAFFFLKNEDGHQDNLDDKFGFKSTKCPPQVDDMKPFEEDMLRMVENIKFERVTSHFQSKLCKDINMIKT